MRVAVLCDIHGNLPALEAVLDEMRRSDIDRVVVGGDVIVGPMTRDALARLLNLDVPVQFVHGNCESAVLAKMAGADLGALPEQALEAVGWEATQLPDYRELIAGWPLTLQLEIPGLGDVLFCHATPQSDTEIFTRTTTEERLLPVFEGLNVVVCGHTHMQFDRTVGNTRIVNAGSVGMPFGPPGADWLVLGPDVQLRRTMYDLANAADRIRRTNYPRAEEFASRYVLNPPSQQEMLDLYAGVESRPLTPRVMRT